MKNSILKLSVLAIAIAFTSCKQDQQETSSSNPIWEYQQTLSLTGVSPIGMVYNDSDATFWVSDGDNNRLIHYDAEFNKISETPDLKRPMHIDLMEGDVYVPQYGNDRLSLFNTTDGKWSMDMDHDLDLDAPAGISVNSNNTAVADFYNNQIHVKSGNDWVTFGTEGNDVGQLYYPTDVQLVDESIYVADAYNHRIQVFGLDGSFETTFGKAEKMNAATGLFVNDDFIYVTDFENSKINIYNKEHQFITALQEGLEKPTDIVTVGKQVFVINYKGHSVSIYNLK